MDGEALIHFIGGAAGGTAGTALTCPLEVIKTRLQSSKHGFDSSSESNSGKPSTSEIGLRKNEQIKSNNKKNISSYRRILSHPNIHKTNFNMLFNISNSNYNQFKTFQILRHCHNSTKNAAIKGNKMAIIKYTSDIIKNEGIAALYKGLGPNVIGVAPSKAVYFYTYSTSKRFWNQTDILVPNSAMVHMVSAGFAGFVTSTVINPIWLVKTRLQLHHGPLTIRTCIHRIYNREGVKGFYKGVTASYMGISETIIQFVLYEHLRGIIDEMHWAKENTKFFNFMIAGGIAKFFACVMAYPHEVVRTRLREEDSGAKGFFRTLFSLYREGGYRAMYRGLSVQLLRSVPNTAITMGTYETVIYLLHNYFV